MTPTLAPPPPLRAPTTDGRSDAAVSAPPPTSPVPPATPPTVRRRRWRRAIWVAAAAGVVLLVVWALRPAPLAVQTSPATRGPLRETVDEEGRTLVHDRYVVAAPVGGRLLRLVLREGDAVAPGQVVARIAALPLDARTADQARARVQAAEAALRQARAGLSESTAQLDQARRDAARVRTLEQAGALSTQAREQAETLESLRSRQTAAARASVAGAEAELRAARAALAGADPSAVAHATVTEVRSPVRGRVLRVVQESETSVAPGTPLVEVADPGGLELQVDVLSADAVRIRPGAPVEVSDWGGAGLLAGRVRTVSPYAFTHVSALGVEERRVHVSADLLSPAPGLGDGYRVEVRIVTWQSPSVLRAPLSALFRRGDGWAAFVVQDGQARLRAVRVGHRGESDVEVLGGLAPGERVIVYPSDLVSNGVKVREQ